MVAANHQGVEQAAHGLGRGRLARAHACGRTSTGGCGADGSMVIKARGSRCPECLTHIRERRSICRKLSRTDLWLEFGSHCPTAVFATRTPPGGTAMEQLHPLRSEHPSRRVTESRRWAFSIVLPAIAAVLLLAVLRVKLRGEEVPTLLMVVVAVGFVAVILLGTRFLIRALREHRESEARFQQMASNIQEVFWMIDAESKKVLYANEAYETITGRSRQSLTDNPKSYEELIHPEDRTHVLTKLEEATRTGQFNERFRIVNAH